MDEFRQRKTERLTRLYRANSFEKMSLEKTSNTETNLDISSDGVHNSGKDKISPTLNEAEELLDENALSFNRLQFSSISKTKFPKQHIKCFEENELNEVISDGPSCSHYSTATSRSRDVSTIQIHSSIRSVRSQCCRICQNADDPGSLISPCLCRGTVAMVHRSCLEQWLNTSGTTHCELCKYQFPTKVCMRYNLLHSLWLWYHHPNNEEAFKSDFVVCLLLSVVTFGIIAITAVGLYTIQATNHSSRLWTQGPLLVFLAIVILVYIINLFLMLKSQLVPWFRWWRSARQVKLVYSAVRERVRVRRRFMSLRKRHNESGIEREIQTIDI